jgi:4-amino-4-deoxy-L-arabinose transferase-like glycosyltransferase
MRSAIRARLALLALALLIAVARLHTYDEPLELDITVAAVIGNELLAGRQLYTDLWDHKPPALHITHALAILLVGYGSDAIYLLNIGAAIVTLLGVYAAASAVGGAVPGLWGAAFWTLVSGDVWLQANQPNAEVFVNACVVWAFALLVHADMRCHVRRFVAIGALFALGSLYKPLVVAPAAVLAIAHLFAPPAGSSRRRAIALILVTAAVGVAAWLITAGYFAALGRFHDLHQAVFEYNRFYAGSVATNLSKAVLPNGLEVELLVIAAPLALLSRARRSARSSAPAGRGCSSSPWASGRSSRWPSPVVSLRTITSSGCHRSRSGPAGRSPPSPIRSRSGPGCRTLSERQRSR